MYSISSTQLVWLLTTNFTRRVVFGSLFWCILFYFDSAEKHVKRGILTIYTNHPSENLVQKHKTIKFDVVGELPTKKNTQNKVSPR